MHIPRISALKNAMINFVKGSAPAQQHKNWARKCQHWLLSQYCESAQILIKTFKHGLQPEGFKVYFPKNTPPPQNK